MVAALALSDLVVHGDEPCVDDSKLAKALGFDRSRNIRTVITRHKDEIEVYGELRFTLQRNSTASGRGRQSRSYWLNEGQAILVCMFARTARAAEVRRQIITVFLAWRRGELTTPPAAPALPPLDPFVVARERIALATAASVFQSNHLPEPLALSVATSPVWGRGRRPNFWPDLPVRTLLTGAHRQMPIATALELCRREFGSARTPSNSAVHRYWMVLDRVRGVRA